MKPGRTERRSWTIFSGSNGRAVVYCRGFPMKIVLPSRFSHLLHRILGAN